MRREGWEGLDDQRRRAELSRRSARTILDPSAPLARATADAIVGRERHRADDGSTALRFVEESIHGMQRRDANADERADRREGRRRRRAQIFGNSSSQRLAHRSRHGPVVRGWKWRRRLEAVVRGGNGRCDDEE